MGWGESERALGSSACSAAHGHPLSVKTFLLVEKVKLGSSLKEKRRRNKQYKGYISTKEVSPSKVTLLESAVVNTPAVSAHYR